MKCLISYYFSIDSEFTDFLENGRIYLTSRRVYMQQQLKPVCNADAAYCECLSVIDKCDMVENQCIYVFYTNMKRQ